MSRCFFRLFALLMLGLCALPALAAKHYISRAVTGQYYAYDPDTKKWQAINDPQSYVAGLYRQQRPAGFGGVIAYKDFVKTPNPVAAATNVAAVGVNTAVQVAERIPLWNRVTAPAKYALMRTFNPPPK